MEVKNVAGSMPAWLRTAAAVLPVTVGDVAKNTKAVLERWQEAAAQGADVILFPELCLTGASCGDLFLQRPLQTAARNALAELAGACAGLPCAAVVGLPLVLAGQLYNCAAVMAGGQVLGVVPKTFVPDYGENYERRWFSASEELPDCEVSSAALGLMGEAYPVPVGRDLLFAWHGAVFGVELGEDLCAPLPPSTFLALGGAQVIFGLAAGSEAVGRRAARRSTVAGQSARCLAGYVYAGAGAGESTTDCVYSGHSLIAQKGRVLAESEALSTDCLLMADIDLELLAAERCRVKTFRDAAALYGPLQPLRVLEAIAADPGVGSCDGSLAPVSSLPFVPADKQERLARCQEIFEMQVAGLAKRLSVTGASAVIGVSGGLDSTLALLVAVETMRRLGRPVTDVHGITMPCFGTTDRTYRNSLALMAALGVTSREIPIREAVLRHFDDIGHDAAVTDVTYENSQARERTQVLMDYAGEVGGLVVGTGDLSELALGWCTYNADHMSMYGVNAGIPKTLIRWMIDALIAHDVFSSATEVLRDVVDTPISPELLPPDAEGRIAQQTEDIVGPYALHDFFLYHMLRTGAAPAAIYALARRAFAGAFDNAAILKWLRIFYRRFFTQQFKRSCLPDGVRVGSVALSPRGDWRMPSDASAALWLAEVDALQE